MLHPVLSGTNVVIDPPPPTAVTLPTKSFPPLATLPSWPTPPNSDDPVILSLSPTAYPVVSLGELISTVVNPVPS